MDTTESSASRAHENHDEAQEQRECFVCVEGYVYIGYMVPLPDGEEAEVIEAVPCKRCLQRW